jgi:hypothetical protein
MSAGFHIVGDCSLFSWSSAVRLVTNSSHTKRVGALLNLERDPDRILAYRFDNLVNAKGDNQARIRPHKTDYLLLGIVTRSICIVN